MHVAVEMKNKMLHRLKVNNVESQGARRQSAYGRFYDMYVKVHENVRYDYDYYVRRQAISREPGPDRPAFSFDVRTVDKVLTHSESVIKQGGDALTDDRRTVYEVLT